MFLPNHYDRNISVSVNVLIFFGWFFDLINFQLISHLSKIQRLSLVFAFVVASTMKEEKLFFLPYQKLTNLQQKPFLCIFKLEIASNWLYGLILFGMNGFGDFWVFGRVYKVSAQNFLIMFVQWNLFNFRLETPAL